MPKGCQNGAKIYAKPHQKSMQKQVAHNMRKIMKSRVFPMCKTVYKHRTVVKKRGLARSVCGAGKSPTNIENDVKIRPKINVKSADPRSGVLDPLNGGRFPPPYPPPLWGKAAAKPRNLKNTGVL